LFFAGNGSHPSHDEVRDSYVPSEVCGLAGITSKQLAELESYGIVAAKGTGASALYSPADLAIVQAASGFLQRGVEARHLRGWRQSAEREASLFEQLVLPLIRQRNPQSRQQAAATLNELSRLGADLRAAILSSALHHHLEA
jgi:DNA-binding transcriptional MerR regulator